MKRKRHAAQLGCLLLALSLGSCAQAPRARGLPASVAAQAAQPITTEQQAIAAAMLLLQHHKANWGPVTRVLRTGSNWFRVEFAHETGQAERVVLVDPVTGEASFPMPR